MKKETEKDSAETVFKKKRFSQGLPVYNPYAAGIDVGDSTHSVAVSMGPEAMMCANILRLQKTCWA